MKAARIVILLVAALVVSGALTIWLLLDRTHHVNRTTSLICEKIDRLDDALIGIVGGSARAPKPGEYGYDYWLHHPGERKNRGVGVGRTVDELRKAACDPHNLSGG